MIKSVDEYDIPNAPVQFASEKNKKKNSEAEIHIQFSIFAGKLFFFIQSSFGNGRRHRFKSLQIQSKGFPFQSL